MGPLGRLGIDPNHYRFRSVWRLAAPPDAVYAALLDVASYPRWWPEVREARETGEQSGELVCRSLLPYDLTFHLEREIEDPVERVLRARLTGDLIGVSQWTVRGHATSTEAMFDEDVAVGNAAVRAAGVLARPALRFNHDRMMRSGERGLRRYLAEAAEEARDGQ